MLTHIVAEPMHGGTMVVLGHDMPKMLKPGEYHIVWADDPSFLDKGLKNLYVIDSIGKKYYAPQRDVFEVCAEYKKIKNKVVV